MPEVELLTEAQRASMLRKNRQDLNTMRNLIKAAEPLGDNEQITRFKEKMKALENDRLLIEASMTKEQKDKINMSDLDDSVLPPLPKGLDNFEALEAEASKIETAQAPEPPPQEEVKAPAAETPAVEDVAPKTPVQSEEHSTPEPQKEVPPQEEAKTPEEPMVMPKTTEPVEDLSSEGVGDFLKHFAGALKKAREQDNANFKIKSAQIPQYKNPHTHVKETCKQALNEIGKVIKGDAKERWGKIRENIQGKIDSTIDEVRPAWTTQEFWEGVFKGENNLHDLFMTKGIKKLITAIQDIVEALQKVGQSIKKTVAEVKEFSIEVKGKVNNFFGAVGGKPPVDSKPVPNAPETVFFKDNDPKNPGAGRSYWFGQNPPSGRAVKAMLDHFSESAIKIGHEKPIKISLIDLPPETQKAVREMLQKDPYKQDMQEVKVLRSRDNYHLTDFSQESIDELCREIQASPDTGLIYIGNLDPEIQGRMRTAFKKYGIEGREATEEQNKQAIQQAQQGVPAAPSAEGGEPRYTDPGFIDHVEQKTNAEVANLGELAEDYNKARDAELEQKDRAAPVVPSPEERKDLSQKIREKSNEMKQANASQPMGPKGNVQRMPEQLTTTMHVDREGGPTTTRSAMLPKMDPPASSMDNLEARGVNITEDGNHEMRTPDGRYKVTPDSIQVTPKDPNNDQQGKNLAQAGMADHLAIDPTHDATISMTTPDGQTVQQTIPGPEKKAPAPERAPAPKPTDRAGPSGPSA